MSSEAHDARRLVCARALRGLGDGALVVLLPAYWLAEGGGSAAISELTTATLLGSALATLAAGLVAHRVAPRNVLFAACALLVATGVGFAFAPSHGWLLAIAFAGTFNPTAGDVSVFLPTEQALLAGSGAPERRAARFSVYNVAGAAGGMLGSYCAGQLGAFGVGLADGTRAALLGYAALGIVLAALYLGLRAGRARAGTASPERAPLRQSRGLVARLAALFALDSFGGGFAIQTLLVAWLIERHHASLEQVSFAMAVSMALSAASQLVAPWIALRIGLIRTMVFTHLPAQIFLVLAAFMPNLGLAITFLVLRSLLSAMDVPARNSYVMAVVSPSERAAAASITNVPRSLASVLPPIAAGWMLDHSTFGWPLVIAGTTKATYDLILLSMFRNVRPPEEQPVS